MKVVLLHGFGAKANESKTTRALKQHLSNYDVDTISYDYHDPDSAAKTIVDDVKAYKEDIVLIAISLGGFWARYASTQCNNIDRVILINPSLNAPASVARYAGTTVKGYYIPDDVGQILEKYVSEFDNELPISIIVAKDDTVVDPNHTLQEMDSRAQILVTTGGHRIAFNEEEVKFINSAINTIAG